MKDDIKYVLKYYSVPFYTQLVPKSGGSCRIKIHQHVWVYSDWWINCLDMCMEYLLEDCFRDLASRMPW